MTPRRHLRLGTTLLVLAYLLGFSLAGKLDKNVYTSNNIPFPRDYSGYEEIDRISGKTAEYILENYVKMGKPVVITDGTKDWYMPFRSPDRQHPFWNMRSLSMFSDRWFQPERALNVAHDSWFSSQLTPHWEIPYFLEYFGKKPDRSAEFLFGQTEMPLGPNMKHLDTGCDHSWAIQLQGEKRWYFWPIQDGGVVKSRNGGADYHMKPLTTLMKPGDMIMFYAGWWHGTYVEKAPCLSMSMYWLHPNTSYMPRHYFDDYAKELLTFPEYCSCAKLWDMNEEQARFGCVAPERPTVVAFTAVVMVPLAVGLVLLLWKSRANKTLKL